MPSETLIRLALSATVQPDSVENLIVPDGRTETSEGRVIVLDEAGAQAIIDRFNKHGVSLPIDYEHSTQLLGANGQRADAAGWIESLRYERGKGLIGRITWNSEGREAIRSGKYRYLSPAVGVEKESRRVLVLESAGLVNKPALPRMEKLAASQHMEKLQMASEGTGTSNPNGGGPAPSPAAQAGGIAPEKMGRVRELLKELAQLTGADSMDELMEAIRSIDQAESETDPETMRATMRGELEAELLAERRVDELVRPWVDILPDHARWPTIQEEYLQLRQMAANFPKMAEQYIAMRKAHMPPQGRVTPPRGTDLGGGERGAVIREARQLYRQDPQLQKQTTEEAVVNLALREKGLPGIVTPTGTLEY